MSWDKDSLLNKSKAFFEKGFEEDKDSIFFGLYCAMGLELLSRAAIAKISPTLLAEPDRDHHHLLHALNLGSAKVQKKSISTILVLNLCKNLIPQFTDDNFKIAIAIINRRNEEVHTGSAAFLEYKTKLWIDGFYMCCKILIESLDENLEFLFGKEEAEAANLIISETEKEVIAKTKSSISAHKSVFEAKDEAEIILLKKEAERKGEVLSHKRHHRVDCPACGCVATVEGDTYGKEYIEHEENEIIVRQNVIPTKFKCSACGLKLSSYGELVVAGISDHFTHRIHYSPEDFYDMINPYDDITFEKYAEERGYRQTDYDEGLYSFSND